MVLSSPNTLTAKQLAKYQRQKCINLLEKITKNLFRMFRNESVPYEEIERRFFELYTKLAEFKHIYLYSPYQREMNAYVEKIARQFTSGEGESLEREIQLTVLNRLQKLKNESKYKKDKHGNTAL